jgi:peptidoglycan/LPS O-acetylase OafA/YrhL
MIVAHVFTWLVFPLLIFIGGVGLRKDNQYFNKDDTLYLRGVAALLVLLSHYYYYIEGIGGSLWKIDKSWSFTGGIGVCVFFFISGYSIEKSNQGKEMTLGFLKKRLFSTYVPLVIMRVSFAVINSLYQYTDRDDSILYILNFNDIAHTN